MTGVQTCALPICSIAVHHFMHDKWNHLIDEAHPPRPGSLYGACKAAVESHLWAAHATRSQPVTAIRPCAVYGIDPNLSRSVGWPIVQSVQQNEPFTKLGGGKFVHVDDVAAATIACINNAKASPCVYNLVDCYARWADWATLTAQTIGSEDRKSTRLNSSHVVTSYAVFCLKKNKKKKTPCFLPPRLAFTTTA